MLIFVFYNVYLICGCLIGEEHNKKPSSSYHNLIEFHIRTQYPLRYSSRHFSFFLSEVQARAAMFNEVAELSRSRFHRARRAPHTQDFAQAPVDWAHLARCRAASGRPTRRAPSEFVDARAATRSNF